MQRSVQSFSELAARVSSLSVFNEIIQKQQNVYDINPYKIETPLSQTILKIYTSIKNRKNSSNQSDLDNNNWNQNERKVFVWFIICYTYFLSLDKKQLNESFYDQLSEIFFGKKPQFLHFQHLNLLKSKERVIWTSQDDQLLIKCTQQLTPGKWNQISKKMFYDSNRKIFRTPKHCRERWLNHLDKNKKHGEWTSKEDLIIFEYVLQNGKRWSKIVPLLNETRTEHMIKNRYNSLISKSKGGKKIKEQEVAKSILNSLTQAIESQSITSSKKQQKIEEKIRGEKVQFLLEQNTRSLQNLCNTTSLSNSPTLPYNTSIQMGCFFNYSCFYFPQIYLNDNRFGLQQMQDRNNPQMQLSKNSSFSLYQPKITF